MDVARPQVRFRARERMPLKAAGRVGGVGEKGRERGVGSVQVVTDLPFPVILGVGWA
jgi:hypothetical protein